MRKTLVVRLIEAADSGDSDAGTSELMREAAASITALRKEMSDMERDFQREARDIAAEARWQQSQDEDYDGSY